MYIKHNNYNNGKYKKKVLTLAIAACLAPATQAIQLEEVIVTAQKRSESIQNVPISIQAFSAEALKAQNITAIDDLVNTVPNVDFVGGPEFDSISIRGITSGVANTGSEQSVGMFVDGIYSSRGYQFNAPFLDVQRVEIMKGPQGILQGKNSVAGAVSITSQRPTQEFEAQVNGGYEAEHGGHNLGGLVSGPLSDNLYGRLVVERTKVDGFLDSSVLSRSKNQNRSETTSGRGSLVWDASESLSIYLKAEYGERERRGQSFGPIRIESTAIVPHPVYGAIPTQTFFETINPGFGLIPDGTISSGQYCNPGAVTPVGTTVCDNTEPYLLTDSQSVTLRSDWSLESASVTSITGWSEYNTDSKNDRSMVPLNWLSTAVKEDFTQVTQEFRIVSNGDNTIDYIAGVFLMDREIQSQRLDILAVDKVIPIIPAAFPVGGGDLVQTHIGGKNYGEDTQSWAVFGQVTWNINDMLRASVGLRYTEEQKDMLSLGAPPITTIDGGVPQPFVLAAFGIAPNAIGKPINAARDEEALDPSINILWDISNDSMLYASWTQATKAGGFNETDNSGNPDAIEFDTETARSIEVGIKSELLDGRLRLNASLFNSQYNDFQVTGQDAATNSFLVGNAAKVTSQGLEADATFALNENIIIGGALGLLDATYDDFPGAQCATGSSVETDCINNTRNAKGDKLRFASDWTINTYITHTTELNDNLDLSTQLSVNMKDEYYFQTTNDANTLQDRSITVDLSITLSDTTGNWDVALIGKNLNDETILNLGGGISFFDGAYWGSRNSPRQIFLQGSYHF